LTSRCRPVACLCEHRLAEREIAEIAQRHADLVERLGLVRLETRAARPSPAAVARNRDVVSWSF
jgi:hypothetical protein